MNKEQKILFTILIILTVFAAGCIGEKKTKTIQQTTTNQTIHVITITSSEHSLTTITLTTFDTKKPETIKIGQKTYTRYGFLLFNKFTPTIVTRYTINNTVYTVPITVRKQTAKDGEYLNIIRVGMSDLSFGMTFTILVKGNKTLVSYYFTSYTIIGDYVYYSETSTPLRNLFNVAVPIPPQMWPTEETIIDTYTVKILSPKKQDYTRIETETINGLAVTFTYPYPAPAVAVYSGTKYTGEYVDDEQWTISFYEGEITSENITIIMDLTPCNCSTISYRDNTLYIPSTITQFSNFIKDIYINTTPHGDILTNYMTETDPYNEAFWSNLSDIIHWYYYYSDNPEYTTPDYVMNNQGFAVFYYAFLKGEGFSPTPAIGYNSTTTVYYVLCCNVGLINTTYYTSIDNLRQNLLSFIGPYTEVLIGTTIEVHTIK